MSQPSKQARFIAALAEAGDPLPISGISRRSGLSREDCGRIASRLVKHGRVSRRKPPLSSGGGFYRYFLTEEQLDDFLNDRRRLPEGLKGVNAIGAAERLRFLQNIRERTVYKDSLVLKAIIGDYERTLGVASSAEGGRQC